MLNRTVALVLVSAVSVVACQWDGGPIINSDSDHNINFGGATEDALPLTAAVRKALRNNPQTSLERIQISSTSEDTVRLAGYVSNAAARDEAERVASGVPGVRFVVNTLDVQR